MFSSMHAGRSAFAKARQLRWSVSPIRLHGLEAIALGGTGFATAFFTGATAVCGLVFGLLFAYRVAIIRHKKHAWIVETKAAWKRWRKGAVDERRTAISHAIRFGFHRLLTAGYFQVKVLFDRRVPGSAANVDEIAIGRWGVANVDTKGKRGRWTDEGGVILYNGRHIDTDTTEWETSELAKVLDEHFGLGVVPVLSIWALQGSKELPFRARIFGKTLVLPAKDVTSTLAKQPAKITRQQIREAHELIRAEFKKHKN